MHEPRPDLIEDNVKTFFKFIFLYFQIIEDGGVVAIIVNFSFFAKDKKSIFDGRYFISDVLGELFIDKYKDHDIVFDGRKSQKISCQFDRNIDYCLYM